MLQAGDAALSHRPSRAASASPQKVWWAGVRGSQGAGEPLRQLCSFIRERVKMHLSRWFYTVVPGHTGSPQVGSSALCVSTHLAKHCIANASGIPPDPPPSHLACKLPSTSPQPCLPSQGPAASLQAPSSRCLSCPPPAHPLPPPQSLRAQKSRETSGKNKSQTPPCHQLPSAYPCPCPQCQLGLSLLQGPAPHPTAPQKPLAATPTLEGMDVHVLGPGGSARLQGAALCSSNLVLPFGWGILTAFSLAQSPPLFQPLDFSIFVLSFLPHPRFARQRACGRTFRRRLSCTRAMRCCGA